MDWIPQLWITSFAAAIFLCFVAQLPEFAYLRWWFCASGIGLSAVLLERMSGGQPSAIISPALILCLCAQLGCIVGGLVRQNSKPKRAWAVFGASILGGTVLLILGNSPGPLAVARGLIPLIILTVIMAYLAKHRKHHPWAVSILFAILWVGILHELLGLAVTLHYAEANFLAFTDPAGGILVPCGSTIALLFLALSDIGIRDGQSFGRAEQLRLLVDSTDQGICEIDHRGQITFVNAAAAEMLAVPEGNPGGSWLQEKLTADDEDSSVRALAEFVLRPMAPLSRVKARILCPDRPPIWVDWSSSPILRDGQPVGATVTLLDVTEREAAVRFIRFRTKLLEMIARNKSVDEVTRLLADAVEERLPSYCCSVLICDGEYFRVVASPHLPEDFRSALHTVPCNRILQTIDRKGSIELNNWEDALRAIARNYHFGGTWSEPMVSPANELLGTVVLHHGFMSPLDSSQARILHEAARLGALAIEHHVAYERLLHQGYHDALTGLPNRLLLADRLQQALARAERNHLQVAYLSIDLDHFKDVNDTYGHDAGDLFLRQISARLATRVRASDTLARTGGDEFTLILPDLQDMNDAGKVAEALTASLRDPFQLQDHTIYGAASIGIALYPRDGRDADTLQRNADRAMYRAKALGHNRVELYSGEESAESRNRIEIEAGLHHAIEQGAFSLLFQPQFTCERKLVGFESLLRFNHPKLGMVPPSRFIPMAEESSLILPIGEWVLQEVCRLLREWKEKGLRPIRIAVNVSPQQLARGDFAETIARTLRATGVKPDLLEMEITEGVLMSSVPDAARQIAEMAKIGVRLSVDDFGTGYSCLSYLHQLPLHTLKIDRSFIARMLEPDGTRCIVEAIVTLARKLDLQTVAEGVENEEQLALLRAAGCNLIQGFLFSRPLTALDASALLFKDTLSQTVVHAASKSPQRSHEAQPTLRFPSRFQKV